MSAKRHPKAARPSSPARPAKPINSQSAHTPGLGQRKSNRFEGLPHGVELQLPSSANERFDAGHPLELASLGAYPSAEPKLHPVSPTLTVGREELLMRHGDIVKSLSEAGMDVLPAIILADIYQCVPEARSLVETMAVAIDSRHEAVADIAHPSRQLG